MVRYERINHRSHRNGCEEEGRDEGWAVPEVQHSDGEGAEDYAEVQPGEEGALVGEEDFGLDARGEGDAFAWGGLVVDWVRETGKMYLGRFGGVVGKT